MDSQIIKKVNIGLVSGEFGGTPDRDVNITSEVRAIINYTGIVESTLAKEVSKTDVEIEVENADNFPLNSYIDINGEEMLITSKIGNKLRVERGQDKTEIKLHVSGSDVKRITVSDNALIPYGDNFGFTNDVE
jgi:hypothetical protein